jgi:hypothetical protein
MKQSTVRRAGVTQISGSGRNVVLYESGLNYFSLFTIGRVMLKWVDTLTGHLAFDRSTQTLSVFGYSSFCADSLLTAHEVKVISKCIYVPYFSL